MDYELAKELKEAGFKKPQFPKGQKLMKPELAPFNHSEDVYEPTLSELIEACGYGFANLRALYERGTKRYMVQANSAEGEWFNGKTPEIAVAKLWLALNKK